MHFCDPNIVFVTWKHSFVFKKMCFRVEAYTCMIDHLFRGKPSVALFYTFMCEQLLYHDFILSPFFCNSCHADHVNRSFTEVYRLLSNKMFIINNIFKMF